MPSTWFLSGSADAYVGNAVTASYLIKKHNYNNLSFSGETEYSSDHKHIRVVKSNIILAGIIKTALSPSQQRTGPRFQITGLVWGFKAPRSL